jgi:hypothetical protein
VRCAYGCLPRHFWRMSERFEIRLAPERRQELAALAAEIGMSASDLSPAEGWCAAAIAPAAPRTGWLGR